MIHVIDNEKSKAGNVIASNGFGHTVRWPDLSVQFIRKSECRKVKRSLLQRVFNIERRYVLVTV